jgi:hypothetical protein
MNPTDNLARNVTPMYPGVDKPWSDEAAQPNPDHPNQFDHIKRGPLNTLLGFDFETYHIPLEHLMPSKKVQDGVMSTRKYKQIVSSMHEIGLIEPLSVICPDATKPEFLLLDGHLRVLALKELGRSQAPCLLARDDETYTYNHRINRLSTIAEHYMIRRAIDRGVSKERLARAFNVNLSAINRRINLLEGICPEAIKAVARPAIYARCLQGPAGHEGGAAGGGVGADGGQQQHHGGARAGPAQGHAQ